MSLKCAFCEVPMTMKSRKRKAVYLGMHGGKKTIFSLKFFLCSLCETLAFMNRWERVHMEHTVAIRHAQQKAAGQ
jgi:hypothetical protein